MKKSVIALFVLLLLLGCAKELPDIKVLDNFSNGINANGEASGYAPLIWGSNISTASTQFIDIQLPEDMLKLGYKPRKYLKVEFFPSWYQEDKFAPFLAVKPFAILGDWSGYDNLNFELKKEGLNTSLILHLFDCKGDVRERWTRGFYLGSGYENFTLVSVSLDQDSWLLDPDPDKNDGQLDLSNICFMSILFKPLGANVTNTYYIKSFYLSREQN